MSEYINYLEINNEKYGYDILAMMKSFYPDKQLQLIIPESREKVKEEAESAGIFASVSVIMGECNSENEYDPERIVLSIEGKDYTFFTADNKYDDFKEGMGAWLYEVLSGLTDKSLPWGTLNGVRPTKLAYQRIASGMSDDQIKEFYLEKRKVSEEKAQLSIDIAHRELDIMNSLHLQDGYSLYIGIPFCPSTCLYCSFTSYPIAAFKKQVDQYIDCLIKEINGVADLMQGKILDTVYMGGGTPTTLEPEQLKRLISHVKERFDFSTVKEFTVEAGRADSITEEKLKVLKELGVTRISVNPQTFNQETLDFIGRKATAEQTITAFKLAREVGFDNINMDTILGLPGEDVQKVKYTMDVISSLKPDSLTVHSLAIKRASKLANWIKENGMELINNTDGSMEIASQCAYELGMKPYYLYRQKNMSGNLENTGFAMPGKNGIYNILIMEEVQTIVACGAGTVTKRVFYNRDSIDKLERCENVKDVALYISKIEEMIDRKRELFTD